MHRPTIFAICVLALLVSRAVAYPTGAGRCTFPDHGVTATAGDGGFVIQVPADSKYEGGKTYTIKISNADNYKGFLLVTGKGTWNAGQADQENMNTAGEFSDLPTNTQYRPDGCWGGTKNSVTHNQDRVNTPRKEDSFTWTAPAAGTGTVTLNWVGVKSKDVWHNSQITLTETVATDGTDDTESESSTDEEEDEESSGNGNTANTDTTTDNTDTGNTDGNTDNQNSEESGEQSTGPVPNESEDDESDEGPTPPVAGGVTSNNVTGSLTVSSDGAPNTNAIKNALASWAQVNANSVGVNVIPKTTSLKAAVTNLKAATLAVSEYIANYWVNFANSADAQKFVTLANEIKAGKSQLPQALKDLGVTGISVESQCAGKAEGDTCSSGKCVASNGKLSCVATSSPKDEVDSASPSSLMSVVAVFASLFALLIMY